MKSTRLRPGSPTYRSVSGQELKRVCDNCRANEKEKKNLHQAERVALATSNPKDDRRREPCGPCSAHVAFVTHGPKFVLDQSHPRRINRPHQRPPGKPASSRNGTFPRLLWPRSSPTMRGKFLPSRLVSPTLKSTMCAMRSTSTWTWAPRRTTGPNSD